MSLTVTFGPLPSLSQLGAVWTELERRAAPSFFKTWTWVRSWLETAAQPNLPPDSLRLLRVARGDALVGLAVVCIGRPRRPWGARTPGFFFAETGQPHLDSLFVEYNGVLADRTCEPLVTAAAVRALCENWPIGRINRMAAADFESLQPSGVKWRLRRAERCPLIANAPQDLESYLAQLGSNTRSQIRRSVRLFGDITVSVAVPHEIDGALADLRELHVEAWAQRERRSTAFGNPLFDKFARAVLTPCDSVGHVELVKIAAGNSVIGILMNFRAGEHTYAYQSGFRSFDDNRLKPGLVCHAYAAMDAFRRGATTYHFMAGQGRYKDSLGTGEETLYSVDIGRPGLGWQLDVGLTGLRSLVRHTLRYR